tara:strand:- start:127 stop:813 length:687 start_codon:yes stop_codon:yes gene_type:complete
MEINKTGKYFKYAIGEIILVVIGILLALQINNWNEKTKQDKEALLIKESLLFDFTKDTIMLKNAIKRTKQDIDYTTSLIGRYEQSNVNLDTLKAIAKDYYPNYSMISSFNDANFQSILSTGKINFLSKELRTLLLENKKLQDFIIEGSTEELYIKKAGEYSAKYPFGEFNKNYVYDIMWEIEDARDFIAKLKTLINFRSFFLNQNLRKEERLLEKTQEIIHKINELDN